MILATAMCAGTAHAQSSPRAAAAEFEAARKAYESLPAAKRSEIQDGLVWSGDYKGAIDGEFGRMTMRAIQAYEARGMQQGDGVLAPQDVAALTRAAIKSKASVGFRMVSDSRAGIRIGLPMKLLKRRNHATGADFVSADKTLHVRSFMVPESRQPLAGLYQDMRAPARGRRVTYRVLRDEFFVVTTESRTRFRYTRVARGAGKDGSSQLRGFTFSVARSLMQQHRPKIEIMTIAISNSFEPFPSAESMQDALKTASRAESGAGTNNLQAPAEYLAATAIAIAPDTYLTVVPGAACTQARIGKAPATQVARDSRTGLTIFRAPVGGGKPLGAAVFAPAPARQPAIGLFAELPVPGGNPHIALARGSLSGTAGNVQARIMMPRSAAGGLVVVADGSLAGLVAAGGAEGRKLAGPVPPLSRKMIAPADIIAFLEKAGIAPNPFRANAAPSAPAAIPSAATIAGRYGKALTSLWCQSQGGSSNR